LRSVLPRDCPTAATSAARLATGHAAAPARSLLQKDWAAQEGAMAGGPGRGIRRHLGDVATANSGDASPPRPGEFWHSPRRFARPSPPSAPLNFAGQGQRWEWKRSSPEPSRPGHWDLDTAEGEIHLVFTETRQVLRAVWATPYIVNAGYPRAVRTHVAPLCLEGPGDGSSPKMPAPGQAPLERSESKEEASSN
jgi:hypothetical protein